MMMMMSSKSFLLALLVILVLAVPLHARNQTGFISINCGAPPKSTYISPEEITYISDASFINTGVSKSIDTDIRSGYRKVLWELRSFPESEGRRNCYKLNVTMGSRYMIRVEFLYGNYDGLNKIPEFGLVLGANWWEETVTLNGANGYARYGIIHTPSMDNIQICLVDTHLGTPFISSIELRPVANDTYVAEYGSLKLEYNVDFGHPESNYSSKYKDDAYDRYWTTYNQGGMMQLIASSMSGPLRQNSYSVPEAVMRTAVSPVNANAPLVINWNSEDQNDQFYFYMHFMEVEDLRNTNNQTREFNITVDSVPWYQNLVPPNLSTTTIYSKSPSKGINIRLEKTRRSTLPPIINAFEVYTVIDLQQPDTSQGDVDAVTTIKSVYGLTRDWQGDPCSPVDYLWDGLNCTNENDSPRITTLNLSSSGLTGAIDPTISQLTILENLDLSNNSLNGQIPDFLSQLQHLKILDLSNNSLNGQVPEFLSQLQHLKILKLEGNNLTGSIPSGLAEKSKQGSLSLSVGQNPYLCESGQCNDKKKKKKKSITLVAAAAAIGLLILLMVVATIFWILKRRKPKAVMVETTPSEIKQDDASMQLKNQVYSYSDVIKITNNFNTILGKGGFGAVYLGYIDDTPVAVKMLSPLSLQGNQQFRAEVKLLMRVHHRNLTSLIGYCNEGKNKGLIYEYMANGNLQEHLSGKDSKTTFLSWEDRLRIAADAASGLEYLHNGCKPPIIHRDVKSSNILLTINLQAKISDFGLSKTIPTDGESHLSTLVAGTLGYLDPNYYQSSRLTEKSDVYSFGTVLLELITSQPVIASNHEKTHISHWTMSMVETGDMKGIVDPRLGGEFDINSAWKAVETAMACVSPNPNARPTMTEIVIELKECLVNELARKKYGGANRRGSVEKVPIDPHIDESIPLAR